MTINQGYEISPNNAKFNWTEINHHLNISIIIEVAHDGTVRCQIHTKMSNSWIYWM